MFFFLQKWQNNPFKSLLQKIWIQTSTTLCSIYEDRQASALVVFTKLIEIDKSVMIILTQLNLKSVVLSKIQGQKYGLDTPINDF